MKKVLSIILMLSIIISLVVSTFAIDTIKNTSRLSKYTNPTLEISSATVNEDEHTVSYDVNIYNNPGIWSIQIFVLYDKDISYKSFSVGDVFSYGSFPISPSNESSLRDLDVETVLLNNRPWRDLKSEFDAQNINYSNKNMSVFNIENVDFVDIENDGKLFTVTLDISAHTEGTGSISIAYRPSFTVNSLGQNIYFDVNNSNDSDNYTYIRGDLDGDGVISVKDLLSLRRVVAGLSSVNLSTGDIYEDGEITSRDVLALRRIIAGLNVSDDYLKPKEDLIASNSPTIYVERSDEGTENNKASFDIKISDNPGIWATQIFVLYDNNASYKSFSVGDVFPSSAFMLSPSKESSLRDIDVASSFATYKNLQQELAESGIDYTNKKMSVIYIENSEFINITGNGTLFTITLDTSALGFGGCDVDIVCSKSNTINFDFQKVYSDTQGTHGSGNNGPSLALFSSDKSLCVEKGGSFAMAFCKLNNGKIDTSWNKISLSVSDETVISISDYVAITDSTPMPALGLPAGFSQGIYAVRVYGNKTGTSSLTVSDTETGLSETVIITVREAENTAYTYKIDEMPQFDVIGLFNKKIPTNIYDLNGLYINNYSCTKSGNKYLVEFDAYNERYHTGAVEIYNADGEWIESEEIKKYSDISSLWDTGEQAVYLIKDAVSGKGLTYQQAASTKHTHISIEVPDGGYFTISNNFAESPGTFLYNSCEIIYEGACDVIDMILTDPDDLKICEFSELVKNEVVKNKSVREEFMKIFLKKSKSEIEKYTKNILSGNIDDGYSGISGLLENMLDSLDISWKHLFKSVTGVGESAFEAFAGPAGVALKGMFAFSKGTSKLMQAINIARSTDKPAVKVYSQAGGLLNPYGISIDGNGNIDTEAVMQVFKVTNSEVINFVLNSDDPLEQYDIYNISLVKNNELVQPNGQIKIMIPIPDGMVGTKCTVFRKESDGNWSMLDANVEGNYLVFYTTHLSLYAITQLPIVALGDINKDDDVTMKDVLLLRRYIAGLSDLGVSSQRRADVNGDNDITTKDVLKLRRMIAGLDSIQ